MSAIMPAIMRLSSLHVYFALINLFNSMQPVISGYRATYNNGYNRDYVLVKLILMKERYLINIYITYHIYKDIYVSYGGNKCYEIKC